MENIKADLSNSDRQVRKQALKRLMVLGFGNPEALQLAQLSFDDSNPSVRAAALRTAILLGPEKCESFLDRMLVDRHWLVRYEAVDLILELGAVRFIDELAKMIETDPKKSVKRHCFKVLHQLCPEKFHERIRSVLWPNFMDRESAAINKTSRTPESRKFEDAISVAFEIIGDRGDKELLQHLELLINQLMTIRRHAWYVNIALKVLAQHDPKSGDVWARRLMKNLWRGDIQEYVIEPEREQVQKAALCRESLYEYTIADLLLIHSSKRRRALALARELLYEFKNPACWQVAIEYYKHIRQPSHGELLIPLFGLGLCFRWKGCNRGWIDSKELLRLVARIYPEMAMPAIKWILLEA